MAVTYTKLPLSGSTNGKNILITPTASTGTTIHTATSTSGAIDEIWLYAYNGHTSDVVLTIEWGDTTSTDQMPFGIQFKKSPFLIIPGWVLKGGQIVTAFAATGNVIVLNGFVNRRTET